MSTVKLNIWVSELDEPCRVSNRMWYVTIYNCDGKPLEWCDKKYVVLPAKCGHLEVEVPPGCYRINAVWGYRFVGGVYYVNHFTDSAVIQACCGNDVCVTLFAPTAHRCGTIFIRAIRDMLKQNVIKPELAKRAEDAVAEVVKAIPQPKNLFELGDLDGLERMVEELDKRFQK